MPASLPRGVRPAPYEGRVAMVKVYIDGSSGTTGLRIRERLAGREDLTLLSIPEELRRDETERRRRMSEADIVFLCLPDAAAIRAAELLEGTKARVLDTSTAHRTQPGWSYGFPELSARHRQEICQSGRVAVPGCHASGFQALVYPLIAGGVAGADYPFSCFSITGYSGGGKNMIAAYEAADRPGEYDSPRQYGVGQQHKHLKEMQAVPGLCFPPLFSPIVADFYSGMTVSVPVYARLLQKPQTAASLRDYFAQYYQGQPLIQVREDTPDYIGANALAGRDSMEIFVSGNDERLLLTARFDNLGKGASGAAIQCMNLMLGIDETTGLEM